MGTGKLMIPVPLFDLKFLGRRCGAMCRNFKSPALGKSLAILLLPLTLAGCLESDDTRSTSFVESANADQPFPANYKPEILAFLKTYLNNPVGVHEAAMAEPVQRTVNGRLRYVSCLRFAERQSDGSYREPRERAVLFVGGRLDRMIANAAEECAGAAYAGFPELEKLTR
jgi:hypothetical protein